MELAASTKEEVEQALRTKKEEEEEEVVVCLPEPSSNKEVAGAGGLLPEPKGKIRVKCIALGGQRQHDSTHFVCSSFPLQSA